MNVLVLGSRREDTAASAVGRALSERHSVTIFDYEAGLVPFGYERWRRLNAPYHVVLRAAGKQPGHLSDLRLRRAAVHSRFDLVFITWIQYVPAEVVQAFRDAGALVVGWFSDAIVNIGAASFIEAPYERVFFKDKVVTARFRSALKCKKYDFLPQAFDTSIHRPVPTTEAGVDVATYGNSYQYRSTLMRQVLDSPNINAVIYGSASRGVDDRLRRVYRPSVHGLAKSEAMLGAKIALNTNHFAELGGVNVRTFELCGMGAFQLTDGPAVQDYFTPGAEVATFAGSADLLEKVRWYLSQADERSTIAKKGLLRAWSEHTFQHRLNQLFASIPALSGEPELSIPTLPELSSPGSEAVQSGLFETPVGMHAYRLHRRR